jgi:hypothetical protein
VDWAALVQRYKAHKLTSGEVKESTWERHYTPRMQLLRQAFVGAAQPGDAVQLLELQAAHWRDRPGCRSRRLQVQTSAAFLRWAVSQRLLGGEWTPPPQLSS